MYVFYFLPTISVLHLRLDQMNMAGLQVLTLLFKERPYSFYLIRGDSSDESSRDQVISAGNEALRLPRYRAQGCTWCSFQRVDTLLSAADTICNRCVYKASSYQVYIYRQ